MFCAKKHKLSGRLARAYIMLFIALLLILSIAVFGMAYRFLVHDQLSNIKISASMIADNILTEIHEGETLDHAGILKVQNADRYTNMFLRDEKNVIVNREYNFPMDETKLPVSAKTPQLLFQGNLLVVVHEQPIIDGGDRMGSLYMAVSLQREVDFLRLLAVLLALADAVGATVVILIGRVVSYRMLSPIQDMIDKAGLIDSHSLKERLEIPQSNDELHRLALTINGMLERVERAFEQQGEFTANASHELRTPLSILQGNVDMLMRWGHENQEVLADSIAVIGRQTAYMGALVEHLLFLARGDSAKQGLCKERFSLGELMGELYEEQTASDASHIYRRDIQADCVLYADKTMIRELLRALIDNSVKFTPEGGTITLMCGTDGDASMLAIKDTGIGMSRQHIDHVFERFYRIDKARSRAGGGMGLGLSIVDNIVKIHDGELEAQSEPGFGTTIAVRLAAG
ncbi:MAG: HAMP domain-containing protein [Clostridiales Family XIII bacterium]|jgi:signal transduction histidine kinase|nr:HAMP domain-containing protein [Clostridiales Family XIII bacterium]